MTHIWPQITYLALFAIAIGWMFAKYEETIPAHVMTSGRVVGLLFARGVFLTILYYGGFFSPLGFAP